MEDVRNLVPRTPPDGFLTWAADALRDELDTRGFLYEQEWVEDWGLDFILDEWAKPRKRRLVRVQCSCCGYQELYQYGLGQRGYGFILPESYSEVEGGVVYESGDCILCPQCGCQVKVRRRAELRSKGYFVPTEGRAMSAAVMGKEQLLVLTGAEKAVVFGDMKNDIPMFLEAAEGYAVANAAPELKAIASGIIGSNREDGVVRWLERYGRRGTDPFK